MTNYKINPVRLVHVGLTFEILVREVKITIVQTHGCRVTALTLFLDIQRTVDKLIINVSSIWCMHSSAKHTSTYAYINNKLMHKLLIGYCSLQ